MYKINKYLHLSRIIFSISKYFSCYSFCRNYILDFLIFVCESTPTSRNVSRLVVSLQMKKMDPEIRKTQKDPRPRKNQEGPRPKRTQKNPARRPKRTQKDPEGPRGTKNDPQGPRKTQKDPEGPSKETGRLVEKLSHNHAIQAGFTHSVCVSVWFFS